MISNRKPQPAYVPALVALAVSISSVCVPLCAQSGHEFSPEKRAHIEAAVSTFMSSSHAPGVSVAVVENGEYEWASGFGFSDLENNSPASEHTLYRLGSISKSLTAVGAMELWERGQLDLDAPVQKYCPAFPQKPWPITTREVMGHLGGIRHYKTGPDDLETNNTKHFDDPIQAGLDFFKNEPLLSEPGKEYRYSTQGYTLVGCVIEGASHAKYLDFMRKNVLAPADMEHTQADNRFAIIPYRTRFYQKTETGTVENAEFLDSSYKIPGGGWISSAEDMARFEVAILNDKLIKRATRDAMWTSQKTSEGKTNGYALGWGNGDDDGIHHIGHDGGQQGTTTTFLVAPDQRLGIVVLANMEGVDTDGLTKEILKILVGSNEKTQK